MGERFLQSVKTTLIKSTTSSWEEAFGELAAYKATHGHCNVPQLFITENGMKLGQWVINQRANYSHSKLSADRIQRLENLGFVWDSYEGAWEEGFTQLAAYKATHGHCNVPQLFITENGMKLGQWVINQRANYSHSKLSADRIQRLENLGFVWDSYEGAWEEGFTQLVAYKATYGDCNVPYKFVTENGMKLGQWVDRQRQFYKNGKLSADRIQRLEALDFVWDMRNSETS